MSNNIFETEKISKAFFKLSIPVVCSMMVSLLYNMVDTYFVALTGNTDLIAGVSVVAPVFFLMIAFGDIFGLGGSSLISRLFGRKEYEKIKNVSAFCYIFAFCTGALLTVILLVFQEPILYAFGANADSYIHASEYYTYLVLAAPFVVTTYVPINQMRSEGLSVETMIGPLVGSVVNIILDPIMIFSMNMGAKGAAVATLIGNICTFSVLTIFLLKKSRLLSMNPKHIKGIEGDDVKQIFSIGIPASFNNLMYTVSMMLTNSMLLKYGNDKIAALGITIKVSSIVMYVLIGFASGSAPLAGYNYGAKNIKRLKDILKFCYTFQIAVALLMSAVIFALAPQMIGIFMSDPGIVETGAHMLRILICGMVFEGIVFMAATHAQSFGKALPALILTISRQGVVFIIILFIFSTLFGYNGIISAQMASDIVTAVIAVLFLKKMIPKQKE